MLLPVNIDATYADDPADASRKLHQQYHDEVHARVKDIRDYGAVTGGSVDNTAAIQAAIDAAATAGGGIVRIPAASYGVSQIKLKTNVVLQGEHWKSALVCLAGNTNTAMIVLDSSSATQTRIRGLFLNGNKTNQTQPVAAVQYLRQTGNPAHAIEDCYIWSFSGRGIDCDTQHIAITRIYVWDCSAEGIYLSWHDGKLVNNDIANSGLENIYIDGAANVHLTDTDVWGAGQVDATRGDGIRCSGAQLKAVNCETSDNKRHGWNLESCSNGTIIGGQAADNNSAGSGGAAIRLAGGSRHLINLQCAGGGRSTESSLLQFDTDGSSYPHYMTIELVYNDASGGGIGTNPEIVGTVAGDNHISINRRLRYGLRRAPTTSFYFKDDFAGRNTTSGTVGELGWFIGAGTVTKLTTPSGGGHPGIAQLDTGASAGTLARIYLDGVGLFDNDGEDWEATCVFKLTQNDTDTLMRIGFSNAQNSDGTNECVWLEKLYADTNFYAVTMTGGVAGTRQSLGAVDTSWHKIRMRRLSTTSIGWTLDTGTEVAITADHITGVALLPVIHVKNQAAASKTLQVDFFDFSITGLGR